MMILLFHVYSDHVSLHWIQIAITLHHLKMMKQGYIPLNLLHASPLFGALK